MKTPIFALLLALTGKPAFAYLDGTYRCKNVRNLPDNVYKVQTISVSGMELPYVEATRYFMKTPDDPHSPIAEAHLKGIASVVTGNGIAETLMLAALQLDFDSGGIAGCVRAN